MSHFGLGLTYRLWGERTKPLVILQHGGKDHGRSWDWTVADLVADYCVAVPDLRGHGDSDRPRGGGYEAFDLVTDFAVIVEDLGAAGFGGPFRVVGHSLGGNVALHYTASQPHRVSHLVAIEGLGFSQARYDEIVAKPPAERWSKGVERRLASQARTLRVFDDQADAVARMAALHPQLSADQAAHLALHALRPTSPGADQWTWKHDPALTFGSLRPTPPSEYGALYGAIPCPVLLMYGADSWAEAPTEDGRMAPFQNASLLVYEKAGHWLHHDQFARFITDIRAFLES